MNLLKEISVNFPNSDARFEGELISFLSGFGTASDNGLQFSRSSSDALPAVSVDFVEKPTSSVVFQRENGQKTVVDLENKTGIDKESPYSYTKLELQDFTNRLTGITVGELDHVGFDIPWFNEGVHPEIMHLRDELRSSCLYYLFPTGEPWDFILPGSRDEIRSAAEVDLPDVRRPKFEIVSLDKVSTPIVQFDFSVDATHEQLVDLFSEAIHDHELKNSWVYIKNPYNIDICFVVGERSTSDWSNFFEGHRLL